MLLQPGLRDIRPPRGMLCPRPRRRGTVLGNMWNDLRRHACRHRLAPSHPRDRRKAPAEPQ
eukprot:5430590-Alexandrium_andersonii.AAC.1